MKPAMRRLALVCMAALSVSGSSAVAHAELLVHEGFPVGVFGTPTLDVPGSATNSGWSGPWQTEAGAARISPWGATLRELVCFDNHVALSGDSRISRLLDVGPGGVFDKAGLVEEGRIGQSGTTLYVGFLQRITTVPATDPALPGYLRYYALEFKSGGGDERRNLEIGHDDRSNSASLACYGAASVVNNGRTDVEPGQFQSLGQQDTRVNMIVVKFTFGANHRDTVEVFRNPDSPTDESAASVTAKLHGDFRFDRIALARFAGNSPTHCVDELRVGTRYADVFAPVDEKMREAAQSRAASQVVREVDAFRRRIATSAADGLDVSECERQLDGIVSATGNLSPWEQLTAIATLRGRMELTAVGRQVDRLRKNVVRSPPGSV